MEIALPKIMTNVIHAPANDAEGFRALYSACNVNATDVTITLVSRTTFIARMAAPNQGPKALRTCKRCEAKVRAAIAAHNSTVRHEAGSLGYYLESK